jgi:arylsulfatase A-like enzyme
LNHVPRQFYRVLLAAAILLGTAGCRCQPSGAPPQVSPSEARSPNVLLIVVDTLRADRLGIYGHNRATSPNLDAFAAKAMVYEQAYSQAPWTTPSIGSLLTGRYPSQLGIHKGRSSLSKRERLLSELLGSKGFQTGAAISHSYCGSAWRFNQGFDSFDESNVLGHSAITSTGVTDKSIEFIDQTDPAKPYFLFAHYFDPHFAYVEHESHSFGQGASYKGPVKSDMRVQALRKASQRLNQSDVDELFRLYDSEIAFTDSQIGRLLSHLEQRGDLENTVVVFTADHGEEFLDHGRWGHTTRLYDEVIRVPLFIRFPDGTMGRESQPVALIDVVPTILGALGIRAPRQLEGIDLAKPLDADRVVFSETSKGAELIAAIRGNHKLILPKDPKKAELYNLETDRLETTNIAAHHPAIVLEFLDAITPWKSGNRATGELGSEVKLSEDEVLQLEALGYVDP